MMSHWRNELHARDLLLRLEDEAVHAEWTTVGGGVGRREHPGPALHGGNEASLLPSLPQTPGTS